MSIPDTPQTTGRMEWEPEAISSITGIASVPLLALEEEREHRRLRQIMRRQIMRNGLKTGGSYKTTVGAVALAASLPAERVVAQLQDGWLIILGADRNVPIETWILEEDGE